MEPYIGEIMMVPFDWAPRGWALCNGQLLSIAQNTALYSLLGTTYGGNGQTTFGLPDLRGRVAVGQGLGPGLPNVSLGSMAGQQTHILTTTEMPAHTHAISSINVKASTTAATTANVAGGVPAVPNTSDDEGLTYVTKPYNTTQASATGTMASHTLQMNTNAIGSSQPHNNMQPYTVVNFVIATEGVFPSRP